MSNEVAFVPYQPSLKGISISKGVDYFRLAGVHFVTMLPGLAALPHNLLISNGR